MPEHTINIVNNLGGGTGGRKEKVSVKKTSEKLTNNVQIKKISQKKDNSKFIGRVVTSSTQFAQGNANGMMKVSAIAGASKIVALLMATSAVAKFAINIYEAETGNGLASSNAKAALDIASSLGIGYLSSSIKNEIFTKRIINRQNLEKEYGRELYNLNNNGEKYKIR